MAGARTRRQFLRDAASTIAAASAATLFRSSHLLAQQHPSAVTRQPIEPWRQGFLDIHHISTGRGNSTLAICPDGTSIMIDAGAVSSAADALGPARPDDSRRPGEWIGRYALRQLKTAPRQELDYFVLTHFHGDHMGDLTPASPLAASGSYRLTGVTDVAEIIPIRCLIDRGFPNYSYPAATTYEATQNYIKFASYATQHGTRVEQLKVGSTSQIVPQHSPAGEPAFEVRNLAANGEVWTGHADETRRLFPDLSTLKPAELPTENACSIALRLSSGPFRYYTGGDLTCDTRFGSQPWMDVETPAAHAVGPVNIATLDHHGYFDGTCPAFVRAMQSRIYILQSWHASHPALSVLDELYSPVLEAGPHDVFATGLVHAASLADARLSDRMLSQQGHVVVRVSPGGKQYEVLVLDDTNEDRNVLKRFGPYSS
jgi:Metallo-beta-lactamase superfamily